MLLFFVCLGLCCLSGCRDDESQQEREGLISIDLQPSSHSEPASSTSSSQEPPPQRQGPPPATPPLSDVPFASEEAAETGSLDIASPSHPAPATGSNRRSDSSFPDPIAEAGAELLQRTQASHWNLDGSLGPEDLTIRLRTDVTSRQGEVLGEAGFNLGVLQGFQGVPKCNLLAFEIAFRAGFVVPLVGRSVGWGFPSSEMIANDARDDHIVGEWAAVRQRPDAAEINLDRDMGTAFMAVARAAIFGRPGHVAIIDWVETLALTREGDIRALSFMGWEANTSVGARYTRIAFSTNSAVPSSRFDSIYILELRAAEPGNEVALIGRGPRNPTGIVNLEGTPDEEGRSDLLPLR